MTKANKTELDNLPTGVIRYTMKNDYMFRAVLQKNENALKGLLYALLSLPEGSITSVVILNPIVLGETIDDKTCILDINIHLPNLTPEFYSEFKMMNTKNHEIYSDKFVLRVLNLKVLDDDNIVKEPSDLYYWAKLFKAQSWEELKMLAEKNSYIGDAVVTLHQMSEDEKIREQCRGREKYNWDMASAIKMGREDGLTEGITQGENRLSALINLLLEKDLTDDISKVTTDSAYRDELYKKYQL